jgi:hypothetical protein
MMTNDDTDLLGQIRVALEEQLETLPPDEEDANIVRSALYALDAWPLSKALQMMAIILMRGYIGSDNRMKYLSQEIEKPFRLAFAMLLRGNIRLSRDIRDTLADLIVMDDEPRWRPRKIGFGFRQEGKRPDPHFESAVVAVVERHLIDGGSVTDGVDAAIEEFSLEERAVREYWGRYAKVMKAMGFKMTKPGRKLKNQT